MVICCWSVKGGQGTSVVAATLALLSARSMPTVLADLTGDGPAILGLSEPSGPGVAEWLDAEAPPDALGRLVQPAGRELSLLPRGHGVLRHGARLMGALRQLDHTLVVVDAGRLDEPAQLDAAQEATTSLLVVRPCYLALRRAVAAPVRPTGIVVVKEEARALGPADVAAAVGVPVRAVVKTDPAIARAVDAGLLASRLPRALERSLRQAA